MGATRKRTRSCSDSIHDPSTSQRCACRRRPEGARAALGLVTSAGPVELGHLVFAAVAPWVTAQDAKHAEPATLEKPVPLDCLAGVLRAARFEPAIALREVPPKRSMVERESVLIEADDPEGEGLRRVDVLASAAVAPRLRRVCSFAPCCHRGFGLTRRVPKEVLGEAPERIRRHSRAPPAPQPGSRRSESRMSNRSTTGRPV